MSPEVIALLDPGADPTVRHTAGVSGGRFVGFPTSRAAGGPAGISDTGDGLLTCTTPALGAEVLGVASFDTPANGTVTVMRAPKWVPVEAGVDLVIGDLVSTDATGKAIKAVAGQVIVGRVIKAALTGALAGVLLYESAVKA